MIPVKICGITSLHDGQLAATLGASAVGFIFYKKSPRYLPPQQAREISTQLPIHVKKVGVFVNAQQEDIHHISEFVGLDMVQLHGDESPEFCNQVTLPIIKAIRVGKTLSFEDAHLYHVHAFLLDTYQPRLYGGTGSPFNWSLLKPFKPDIPIVLSGGLRPDNILQGIQAIHPTAVDVNSGVESSPGKKDESKLRALFQVLKMTHRNSNIFTLTSTESTGKNEDTKYAL